MVLSFDMKCSDLEGGFPAEKNKLCLFCYKSIPPDGRFGNINEGENRIVKRLGKLLEEFVEEKINMKGCDDKWLNCCGDCEKTLESVFEFYHQWKCLELRVHWKLEKMVNVMKFANRVPSRVQQMKLMVDEVEVGNEDGFGGDKFKSFKGFRSAIIKKCAARLKKSQPKVTLKRWNCSRAEADNKAGVTTPSATLNIVVGEPENKYSPFAPIFTNFLGWIISLSIVVQLATITSRSEAFNTFPKNVDDQVSVETASIYLEGLENIDDDDPGMEDNCSEGKLFHVDAIKNPILLPNDHEVINCPEDEFLLGDDENTVAKDELEDSIHECKSGSIHSDNGPDFPCDTHELPEVSSPFDVEGVDFNGANQSANLQEGLAASPETKPETFENNDESVQMAEPPQTKSYNLRQNRKRTYLQSLELDEEKEETSDHSENSQINSEESSMSSDTDIDEEEQKIKKHVKKNQYPRKRKSARHIKHCDICNKELNTWYSQTMHFKNCHDISGMDPAQLKKCCVDNCKAYFKTIVQRNAHMLNEHPKNSRMRYKRKTASEYAKMNNFSCRLDGCSTRWKAKYIFQEHQRLHVPGNYKCQFCDKIEENVARLCKHEAECHPPHNKKNRNKTIFSCARCAFQSKHLSNYQWHFAEAHIPGFEKRGKILFSQPCEICGKRTINRNQDTHFKNYHDTTGMDPEQILKCNVKDCLAYFKNKLQRYVHIRNQHGIIPKIVELYDNIVAPLGKDDESRSTFVCSIANCRERFDTSTNLETHQKLHGSFKCHFCDVVKEYAPEIALHELEHAIREPGKTSTWKRRLVSNPNGFNCPRCAQTLPYETYYIRHHLKKHLKLSSTTRIQICPICQAESKGGPDFQLLHFKICHNIEGVNPEQIVRCDQCPAYFVKTDQLIDHKAKVHYKRKCPECGKCFVAPSTLKLHVEERHPLVDIFPTLKFHCDMANCRRKFGTQAERDNHKLKDRHFDDDELKCSKCGKIFTDGSKLLNHMKAIHPEKSLICNECGKSFKSMDKLKTHLEFHKGPDEWQFQCSTCGKKCVNRFKLAEHVRTHTKEKPFVCQVCGGKYGHRHNWLNHMKTKHPDEFNEMDHESGKRRKVGGNFLSRKGSKKGECITSGVKQL